MEILIIRLKLKQNRKPLLVLFVFLSSFSLLVFFEIHNLSIIYSTNFFLKIR